VFAEVAQQVLEYLGVAHDIELHTVRAVAKDDKRFVEDDAGEHMGDINAIYNAANDLPNDDPLRGTDNQTAASSQPAKAATPSSAGKPGLAAVQTGAKKDGKQAANTVAQGAAPGNPVARASKGPATTANVTVKDSSSDAKKLRVPSLIGLPVRKVIEQAAAAGLEVQISGNGTVREQAPPAGTMVMPGTQIVVRCGH
jgi:cell division protein FtsI (penicillin-binding protein 3)